MSFKTGSNSIIVNNELVFYNTNDFNSTDGISGSTVTIDIPSPQGNDQFGYHVAVGNDLIVVGAPNAKSGNTGAVYVFELDGTYKFELTASDATTGDYYGGSVAVGCGRIVVGAYSNDPYGVIYIYDLDGSNERKINYKSNLGRAESSPERFGWSVAVGHGRIIVGDPRAGYPNNEGNVYILDLEGRELQRLQRMGAYEDSTYEPTGGAQFGWSVAIGCGRIAVGAYVDEYPDAPQAGYDQGAAYIYDLYGNFIKKIGPDDLTSDPDTEDNIIIKFGYSVSLGGGKLAVGCQNWPDFYTSQGAVYIYDLNGNREQVLKDDPVVYESSLGDSVAAGDGRIAGGDTAWTVQNTNDGRAYLFNLDGDELEEKTEDTADEANGRFGYSVALGHGKFVVGAMQMDGSFSNQGRVFIYNVNRYDHLLDFDKSIVA